MNDKELNDDISDVEEEKDGDVSNAFPFDSNKISINITPRNIGQLVEMLQFNEIIIPPYQRLPNLWGIKQKSRFIESLILKLPIPLFYFSETEDEQKWIVVDGLQRISTLEHFIVNSIPPLERGKMIADNKKPFKLEQLEFREDLNGKGWNDLPRDIQRRININQVTINLIGRSTPDLVKYNIFSRINQGGITLTPQEIRTALFQGYQHDLVKELVSPETDVGKLFLQATQKSVSCKRQEDWDFSTRFLSFFLQDYESYQPDMNSFMLQGIMKIPKNTEERKSIVDKFKQAMELANFLFEKDAFRKWRVVERRMPINKPLFEVISVHFAKLSDGELMSIKNKKERFMMLFNKLKDDEEFVKSITFSTASKEKVEKRHDIFIQLLKEVK